MIKSGALSKLTNVSHGFFTRHGGISTGIYAGRNCGLGSDDLRAHVIENRGRTADDLNVPRGQLVTVHQIHSATAITASDPWTQDDAPQGDALVTATPGIGLGILTADCTPILFADPVANVIGAAHAGWKGAISGVLEATVDAMTSIGARREQILSCIGPTISQTNYEVGPEFEKQFTDQETASTAYFIPSARDGHFQFDLPGYVANRLTGLGLNRIENTNLCTYADRDRFFSFRRTTHAGEPDYGRQISAIALHGA